MGDVERAFAVGADDYITKPFDPAKLSQMVAVKLGRKASRRPRPAANRSGPGIGTGLGGAQKTDRG